VGVTVGVGVIEGVSVTVGVGVGVNVGEGVNVLNGVLVGVEVTVTVRVVVDVTVEIGIEPFLPKIAGIKTLSATKTVNAINRIITDESRSIGGILSGFIHDMHIVEAYQEFVK
jgi:hypothetical protein